VSKTYTCAHCGGTFESGWSDEDANAEALENWGVTDASRRDDMAEICDDCHAEFTEWLKSRESRQ
jgi:DNA-directed RNA polymerase subunit RPC12/RpoP